MLEYDIDDSVGYWVWLTYRALEQAVNAELAPHGITARQFQVLFWFSLEGEMSQSEMAEKLGVEPPTLVGILTRMEQNDWITRRPSPDDRRKKLIQPTERVEPLWEKMKECAHRVRARALTGIRNDEVDLMRSVLATIRENLRNPTTDSELQPTKSNQNSNGSS